MNAHRSSTDPVRRHRPPMPRAALGARRSARGSAVTGWLALVLLAGCAASTPSAAPAAPSAALASPSAATAASAPPSGSAALTEAFTSTRHGISISHPAGWVTQLSTEPWKTGLPGLPAGDRVHEPSDENRFISVASQPLGARDGADWASEVARAGDWEDTCEPVTEPVAIDGASGTIVVHCPSGIPSAMAWDKGRGYLIVLYPDDDVDWFKDILATVKLHPEDAAE